MWRRTAASLFLFAALGIGDDLATRITFTWRKEFQFEATFSGKKGEDVSIETQGDKYQLHRTKELGGRKFVDDAGHVILILNDARSASLTRWDVLFLECPGSVPDWLLEGKDRPSR